MQVSVERTGGLERRMRVSLPSADIEAQVAARLQKAQRTAALDGFRKGRVPMSLLRQRFGAAVRGEVLGELVSKSYGEALAQEKIRPAGQPRIEPLEPDEADDMKGAADAEPAEGGAGAANKSFSYTATFEVYPEVDLGDLAQIQLERLSVTVADADVERAVEALRRQRIDWQPVERAAADGDRVRIDFVGRIDGEPFANGSAENAEVVLGSGQILPALEAGICGMRAGEERDLPAQFPPDYPAESLAGAQAVFAVRLHQVSAGVLPSLDADFLQKFGIEGGDLAAFKVEIRTRLEREAAAQAQARLKGQVMDALVDMHSFALPQALVAEEIERMKQQLLQQNPNAAGQGADLPDEPFAEQAERRVRLGLVVAELVRHAGLVAEPEAVKAEIAKIAAAYPDPQQVERHYYGNPQLLDGIEMQVLEERVVEHVLAAATVKDVALSYGELAARQ